MMQAQKETIKVVSIARRPSGTVSITGTMNGWTMLELRETADMFKREVRKEPLDFYLLPLDTLLATVFGNAEVIRDEMREMISSLEILRNRLQETENVAIIEMYQQWMSRLLAQIEPFIQVSRMPDSDACGLLEVLSDNGTETIR